MASKVGQFPLSCHSDSLERSLSGGLGAHQGPFRGSQVSLWVPSSAAVAAVARGAAGEAQVRLLEVQVGTAGLAGVGGQAVGTGSPWGRWGWFSLCFPTMWAAGCNKPHSREIHFHQKAGNLLALTVCK